MRRMKTIIGLTALAALLFAGPAAAAGGEGTLEALGSRSGPFCETFERSRSKHVRVLCVGNVELRWKLGTLYGDPVVRANARWTGMVDSILLQTNTAFSAATASAKVQAAFARVGPTDMLLKTDVEVAPRKPCGKVDTACQRERAAEGLRFSKAWPGEAIERERARRQGIRRITSGYQKVYLMLDPGALGKKGKWSFNAASSPSWGKLFDNSLIRCDSRGASAAATPGFVPAEVAKLAVRQGITLKTLGGCRITFGGLYALNRALEETCEGYTGDDAARRKCLEKNKKKKELVNKKKHDEEDAFDKAIADAEGGADKDAKPKTPDADKGGKPAAKRAKDPFEAGIAEAERGDRKKRGAELARRTGGSADGGKGQTAAHKRLIDRRDANIKKCDVAKPKPPAKPVFNAPGLSFTVTFPPGHPRYCDDACKERGARRRAKKARRKQEYRKGEWAKYNAKLRQYNEVTLGGWRRQRARCIQDAKTHYRKRVQDLRDAAELTAE